MSFVFPTFIGETKPKTSTPAFVGVRRLFTPYFFAFAYGDPYRGDRFRIQGESVFVAFENFNENTFVFRGSQRRRKKRCLGVFQWLFPIIHPMFWERIATARPISPTATIFASLRQLKNYSENFLELISGQLSPELSAIRIWAIFCPATV